MAKKKTSPQEEAAAKPSFEEAVERLEAIVAALESGELSLDDALWRYEEGVKLLRVAHGYLKHAELRIETLSAVRENGEVSTTPFDEGPTTKPGRRRTEDD